MLYTVVLEGYHPHRSTLNSICVEKKKRELLPVPVKMWTVVLYEGRWRVCRCRVRKQFFIHTVNLLTKEDEKKNPTSTEISSALADLIPRFIYYFPAAPHCRSFLLNHLVNSSVHIHAKPPFIKVFFSFCIKLVYKSTLTDSTLICLCLF